MTNLTSIQSGIQYNVSSYMLIQRFVFVEGQQFELITMNL